MFLVGEGGGGVLKPNIMVRKGAIVTYIWSFYENFENYKNWFHYEKIAFW